MPRTKPTIHIETIDNAADATETDLRRWVRATEILLRAKARRDARLAAQVGPVRRTVLTISFHFAGLNTPRPVAAAS